MRPAKPPPAATARFALRAATAQAHSRLDEIYSSYDLSRTADYGAFLLAHAPAYVAVEQALIVSGADRLAPGWLARLRSPALAEDIAGLGLSVPPPIAPPIFQTEAQILGGLYVLEGSRLGGAVLIRAVAPGLPTAFLTAGNPADWRALISVIDLRLSSDALLADAVSAAHAVFATFERSARAQRELLGRDR